VRKDGDLLTLFNDAYPLPNQNSLTVFQFSYVISMRVISVLQMQAFGMAEWRRLSKLDDGFVSYPEENSTKGAGLRIFQGVQTGKESCSPFPLHNMEGFKLLPWTTEIGSSSEFQLCCFCEKS
jgi:hypothetical protein